MVEERLAVLEDLENGNENQTSFCCHFCFRVFLSEKEDIQYRKQVGCKICVRKRNSVTQILKERIFNQENV